VSFAASTLYAFPVVAIAGVALTAGAGTAGRRRRWPSGGGRA
jgi:hypothetical protein